MDRQPRGTEDPSRGKSCVDPAQVRADRDCGTEAGVGPGMTGGRKKKALTREQKH